MIKIFKNNIWNNVKIEKSSTKFGEIENRKKWYREEDGISSLQIDEREKYNWNLKHIHKTM